MLRPGSSARDTWDIIPLMEENDGGCHMKRVAGDHDGILCGSLLYANTIAAKSRRGQSYLSG